MHLHILLYLFYLQNDWLWTDATRGLKLTHARLIYFLPSRKALQWCTQAGMSDHDKKFKTWNCSFDSKGLSQNLRTKDRQRQNTGRIKHRSYHEVILHPCCNHTCNGEIHPMLMRQVSPQMLTQAEGLEN